jgi:hypothetical protein
LLNGFIAGFVCGRLASPITERFFLFGRRSEHQVAGNYANYIFPKNHGIFLNMFVCFEAGLEVFYPLPMIGHLFPKMLPIKNWKIIAFFNKVIVICCLSELKISIYFVRSLRRKAP